MRDCGKICVLGTNYRIMLQKVEENSKLEGNNGIAELYNREVIVRTGYESDPLTFENIESFKHKVLTHELFHAIFHEAGHDDYCEDEKLVNALAVMWPKIKAVMDSASLVDLSHVE